MLALLIHVNNMKSLDWTPVDQDLVSTREDTNQFP